MAYAGGYPVKKNTEFLLVFPIYDADGDLVTGATGLDSEVSKDGAGFNDCDNEATEIGASGIYKLTLTATEMNADIVALITETTTTGAKTTSTIIYTAAAQVIDVWDAVLTGATHNVPTSAGRRLRAIEDVTVLREETAVSDGGGTATIELDAAASAVDDFYVEDWIMLTSGTGIGQMRHVESYDGTTKIITVVDDWNPAIDGTEKFVILARTYTHPHKMASPALVQIADAVHDEVVEGTLTQRQATRLMLASLTGKSSGGGGTELTFRDVGDTKDRLVVTVDKSGNRTAVDTRDGS